MMIVGNEINRETHENSCVLNIDCYKRYISAGSPQTTQDSLGQLALDRSNSVRLRVAENSHTPLYILEELAFDENPNVRLAVAENNTTPLPLLEVLAQDPNEDVRYGIAESFSTPTCILKILANDENPYVSSRAEKTIESILRQVRPAA